MMRKRSIFNEVEVSFILVPLLVLTTFEVLAQSNYVGKDWVIDSQHSYIGFRIKYFGFSPVRGRFDAFDGTVFYDGFNPESIDVTVFLEAKSIDTGVEKRDSDLVEGDGWFNVMKYPHLSFRSNRLVSNVDRSFIMEGILTINGIEKLVKIPFGKPTAISSDWAGNEQVDFSGKFVINRQDFKVYGGDFWSSVMENGLAQLSNDVEIEVDIHIRRPNYEARYASLENEDVRKQVLDIVSKKGIKEALKAIRQFHESKDERLTSGAISTIGYTLLERGSQNESLEVFKFKEKAYPDRSTWNQLGVAYLAIGDKVNAKKYFEMVLKDFPTDCKAVVYLLRLARD